MKRVTWPILAAVGWLWMAFAAYGDPTGAARAYLPAFQWVLALPVGSLAFLMIHHATGGAWGRLLGPALRAGAMTMPVMILLALPLLGTLPSVYPWARPEEVAATPLWQHREAYLNPLAYTARLILALLIWSGLARAMRSERPNPALQHGACAGLVFHLAVTGLLAMDSIGSLEAHFRSSLFGLVVMVLQAISAFSLLTLWACLRYPRDARLKDLGGLLMAQVMLVGYLQLSQFLIIWSGNLPEETGWLATRAFGPWGGLAVALVALQFVLPFVLLGWGQLSQGGGRLSLISGLLLVMSAAQFLWLIVPSFSPEQFAFSPAHPAAFLALACTWATVFHWTLDRCAPSEVAG